MPAHETKFNNSWLEKTDSSDILVKRWLKSGTNPTTFICTICNTGNLYCGNKGWSSVECHVNNKKHCDKLKLIKENSLLSTSKVSHHFFVFSCLFQLHNIYLIRSYPRIVEIKYYIYIYVQNEKPLNMKYTEKNKLQYFEKNNRKNYKIIVKMFGRRFFVATGIY